MALVEARIPKYMLVLQALRQRIEDGTYRPGGALPSESQIATEFGVARATVLKSLQALKQDGWIESQQGKANFVRGRPTARRTAPAYARAALDADESAGVELVSVVPVLADPRIAGLLNLPEGTPVYRRIRRTSGVDLVTVVIPVEVAVGSGTMGQEPVTGSLLAHPGHPQRHPWRLRDRADDRPLPDAGGGGPARRRYGRPGARDHRHRLHGRRPAGPRRDAGAAR
jgi:GntR family transcriptional regulator